MALQESHLHELGSALGAKSLACPNSDTAACKLAHPLWAQVVPAVQVVKISSGPCPGLSFQHHATAACKDGILETFEIMLAAAGPLERVETVF